MKDIYKIMLTMNRRVPRAMFEKEYRNLRYLVKQLNDRIEAKG